MSAAKLGTSGAVILFCALLFFRPESKPSMEDHEMLFANPVFFRALNGNFHSLSADWLWLLANNVSEIKVRYEEIDTETFYKAFETISTMDSHFVLAVNYGALFLASVQQNPDKAISLLERALVFHQDSFMLRFIMLGIMISYVESDQRDYEKIAKIAKEAYALPDSDSFINKKFANRDFVEDILLFARKQSDDQSRVKEDLLWLLKRTQDEEKREQIRQRLKEIGG